MRTAHHPRTATAGVRRRRPRPPHPPATLVKICGLTSPADAAAAAAAGADLLGVILWPKTKRGVSVARAAEIAAAGRAAAGARGVTVVGVFVDEDAATIAAAADAAGLDAVQLHGDGARAGLTALAGEGRATVWVHAVAADGAALTPPPPVPPTWILVDGAVGGSGETYDWGGVAAPTGATRGWLLAGGLTPDTVAAAVAALGPTGVDVSSGVCGADGMAKDKAKIEAFVKAAKL
jgi:phosphoribosylanthranilate isomerase